MFSLEAVDEVGQIEFSLIIEWHQSVKLTLLGAGVTY